MRLPVRSLTGIAALAVAAAPWAPTATATQASASGSDQPALKKCVTAEQAGVRSAGGDSGPPKFTRAFFAHTFTLNASLDGVDGTQLPISIEEVCSVPKSLKKQAVQLAGTDGVALLSSRTTVWVGGKQQTGSAAATALDGADTAVLTVRLATQPRWAVDEDGNKIPTFVTRRVKITD
jgi:hypothetical protein